MHARLISMAQISLIAVATVAFSVAAVAVNAPTSPMAAPAAAQEQTQDVVIMRDGRELTGQIVSEEHDHIVFRYVDSELNLETTLTLRRSEIARIERDVPVEVEADPEPEAETPAPSSNRPSTRVRGLNEGDADDSSLPSFYVIPMKGQMGTDIHPDIYREVAAEIRAARPDLVIWDMDCTPIENAEGFYMQIDQRELSIPMLDEYRELVRLLHNELSDVPQVMWVEDSVGFGSLVALAWERMYMKPDAQISGLGLLYVRVMNMWNDEDVRAKQLAAVMSIMNGFFQRAGRALELGEAMIRPDRKLSATWRGRDVVWGLNTSGEYIVDNSAERTTNFNAKTAEDFGVSLGTAETLDDLALQLGYREYRVIDGAANQMVEDYVEDWRRLFDTTKNLWRELNDVMSRGGDLRTLGRAKSIAQQIVSAMNRYPAIELRFQMEFGVRKFDLETLIEQLNERIRALRSRGRNGGGGGRPGGPPTGAPPR